MYKHCDLQRWLPTLPPSSSKFVIPQVLMPPALMPPVTMLSFPVQSFLLMRKMPPPLLSNSLRRQFNTPSTPPEFHPPTTPAPVQSTPTRSSHRGRSPLRRVQGPLATGLSCHELGELFSRQFSERDDAWYKRAHGLQTEIHEKDRQITTLTVEYHFSIFLIISNF